MNIDSPLVALSEFTVAKKRFYINIAIVRSFYEKISIFHQFYWKTYTEMFISSYFFHEKTVVSLDKNIVRGHFGAFYWEKPKKRGTFSQK